MDARGGADPKTEDAALRRIIAAGEVTTFAAELTGDLTRDIGSDTLVMVYDTLAG